MHQTKIRTLAKGRSAFACRPRRALLICPILLSTTLLSACFGLQRQDLNKLRFQGEVPRASSEVRWVLEIRPPARDASPIISLDGAITGRIALEPADVPGLRWRVEPLVVERRVQILRTVDRGFIVLFDGISTVAQVDAGEGAWEAARDAAAAAYWYLVEQEVAASGWGRIPKRTSLQWVQTP